MIPRRVSSNTLPSFLAGEGKDRITRPAELEGPHFLEILAFTKQRSPNQVIQARTRKDWGAVDIRLDACSGSLHLGEPRILRHNCLLLWLAPTAVPLTAGTVQSVPARCAGLISQGWLCDGSMLERRQHFRTKALQLFHSDLLKHAHRQAYRDSIKTWIAFFQRFEVLNNLLGRATQEATAVHGIFNPGELGIGGAFGVSHNLDLLVSQGPHQA